MTRLPRGVVKMRQSRRASWFRTLLRVASLALGIVLGAMALFEVYLRLFPTSLLVPDAELGWALSTAGGPRERKNHCGETARIQPPPRRYLIRDAGPCAASRTLVFIVGDSTTHAPQVSTGYAYYDVFARHVGDAYCVYAAGVSGYGTLQETLLLERFAREKGRAPDLVLWQTTPNDIINNVYELERSDPRDNNLMRRPYLDLGTGRVRLRNPAYWPFGTLLNDSWAFRALFARVLSLAHQRGHDWPAHLARAQGFPDDQRQARIEEGHRVVERLVARTRERFPSTDIIGFPGAGAEGGFATAFESAGASYFRGLTAEAERHGRIDCRPLDLHWNHRGHEVVGRLLQSRLLAFRAGASRP